METHVQRFDAAASSYEAAGELQDYVARRLAEGIYRDYLKPGQTVLEIGCGTGFLTRHLPSIFGDAASFIITDKAPSMVDTCRGNFNGAAGNMRFETMDGQNVTLPECSVDAVVSSMVFQWFDNPVQKILELQKLLRPGGTMTYATVGCDNFTEWRKHLEKRGLDFGMRELPANYPSSAWSREEFIKKDYTSGRKFLEMLKNTGAGAPKPGYNKPPGREFLNAVKDFDGKVTWHIVYGRLPALTV